MPELFWLSAALLAYVAAGCVALGGTALGRLPERPLLALLASAVALHSVALALRWARLGHGPFVTLYEILSSNIWSLALVFALAFWRLRPVRPGAVFVLPVLFLMMGWLLVASPDAGHQPPTYRTLWLYVHVGLGKLFLGALLVAVGLCGVLLARAARPAARRFASLPDDARVERLAFRFVVVAFLFDTLMLIAGAIWAQGAWGRYWAWDPLETWAFSTWLALGFFIHLRATWTLPPRYAALAIVGVFSLAFLTFFGVPFVSVAPHKGAL
jgi:ABC-type transport system involved in cytochrome c biogenesis permease subunit